MKIAPAGISWNSEQVSEGRDEGSLGGCKKTAKSRAEYIKTTKKSIYSIFYQKFSKYFLSIADGLVFARYSW
jgi:hypothetical protein